MQKAPLKITGPSFIGQKSPSQPGPKTLRLWPTNRGVMTLTQLSRSLGITRAMMEYQIKKSGIETIDLDDIDAQKTKNTGYTCSAKAKPRRRSPESIPVGTWELAQLQG